MKNKMRITIEEDTVTEYLTKLLDHFQGSQEVILDNLANELSHKFIEPYVPKWNPNLYESGENPNYWFKNISMERSTVEVLYTGFTEFAEYMDVFFEMGGYSTLRPATLQRDYAYYQETGRDIFHGSYPEAPPFEGHHYVQKGTADYSNFMANSIEKYMNQIMKLRAPSKGQQIL